MNPLSPEDNKRLQAAQGWLELGNALEANEELDRITAVFRAHPRVLLARAKVYAAFGKWAIAMDLLGLVVPALPNKTEPLFLLSDCLQNLEQLQASYELLRDAARHFSKDAEVHYRLACVAARLNKHEEAYITLNRAFEFSGADPNLKLRALDEKALEGFWLDIGDL